MDSAQPILKSSQMKPEPHHLAEYWANAGSSNGSPRVVGMISFMVPPKGFQGTGQTSMRPFHFRLIGTLSTSTMLMLKPSRRVLSPARQELYSRYIQGRSVRSLTSNAARAPARERMMSRSSRPPNKASLRNAEIVKAMQFR